ncbi:MAG: phosphoribosyltransferase family protein [Sedimentisphaerales bacterium]|jgi:putative phosphoribosyl transferase
MFDNRKDAGQKLGKRLSGYKGSDALVLAIPRGGVEVGHYVAEHLELAFSIIVVRKLPFPYNPEAGFGAVAEDGSIYLVGSAHHHIPEQIKEQIIDEQKQEIERRIKALRGGNPLPEISDRTVILVDDGIAMGSTMNAAIMLCRNKQAGKIVVAAPVASPEMEDEIAQVADKVVILEKPPYFRAVAEAYRNWYDVGDDEVMRIIEQSSRFAG